MIVSRKSKPTTAAAKLQLQSLQLRSRQVSRLPQVNRVLLPVAEAADRLMEAVAKAHPTEVAAVIRVKAERVVMAVRRAAIASQKVATPIRSNTDD
jgi:hypothetical protein